MNFLKADKDGLFKSIFTAYFILLLHVFLLAGVGVSVVLFKGVYHYLPYIMAGLAILILSLAWVVYQKIRKNSNHIMDVLSTPQFQDRTVEIKLLGGLATFKIKAKENNNLLLDHSSGHPYADTRPIQTSVNKAECKMLELNTLYDKDLITKEEFKNARQNIIQG
ncbi:MAG: SHOCT domain-containing protein [Desulfobacteraceae bacterium]|nr:SHOCT domain-containing protein [Desulfobacteraceae bacterium]